MAARLDQPFQNGVYVDAEGVMRRLKKVERRQLLSDERRPRCTTW